MDTNYINDITKWYKNDDVKTVTLNSLSGYYQYLFDKNENTIYFHISYSLENLDNKDEIKIRFSSSNKLNHYKIIFNNERVNYFNEDTKKSFNVLSSFKTVVGNGQDILFGIEFLNKEDKKLLNDISITLDINNKSYKIANNMILEFNDVDNNLNSTTRKDKTTTNKSSTTKPSKENNSSNVTTKFYYNGQINNNQNNNAEFNNNFIEGNNQDNNNKYNYDSNNNYAYDNNEENTNFIDRFNNNNDGQVVIPENETKSTLSPISKILIASSVILCALGTVLIVHYIIKSKKEKSETKKEESNE